MSQIAGFSPVGLTNRDRNRGLYIVCFDNELICPVGRDSLFWTADVRDSLTDVEAEHFVGHFQGRPCWVLVLPQVPSGLGQIEYRKLRGLIGQDELFQFAGRAMQLVNWYKAHQFCGQCGKPADLLPGESAMHCKTCNLTNYPRVSPCAIMLVTRGDQCLLAKHGRRPNYFSCLAGFVEAGETIEQTVRRECMEEVGIEVANLRYFGSQPWPFPGQLMFGFHAEYASGEITPDGVEIVEADWFHFDRLPAVPGNFSVSGQLIEAFVARCRLT